MCKCFCGPSMAWLILFHREERRERTGMCDYVLANPIFHSPIAWYFMSPAVSVK